MTCDDAKTLTISCYSTEYNLKRCINKQTTVDIFLIVFRFCLTQQNKPSRITSVILADRKRFESQGLS